MKRLGIVMAAVLASCTAPDAPEPRAAFVSVEVEDRGGGEIETLRLLLFTDPAGEGRVALNRLLDQNDLATGQPPGQGPRGRGASTIGVVLEAGRFFSGSGGSGGGGADELLVVAIANEPAAARAALEAVGSPGELAAITVAAEDIGTPDPPGTPQPLSGAVWCSAADLRGDPDAARDHPVAITLGGVVARVEVWLRSDLADGISVTAPTSVTLAGTGGPLRLVRHADASGNALGTIPPAPATPASESWTLDPGELAVPGEGAIHLCTFLVPERAGGDNPPRLTVEATTTHGATRGGVFALRSAVHSASGVERPIAAFLRGNIYRVTVTLGANGCTALVTGWRDDNITVGI